MRGHLELSKREPAPEAHARAVDEREQVAVALDLLRLAREARRVQPALGAERARVRAPDRRRRVHVPDWHADLLTFAYRDVVYELAIRRAQRPRERDDVVFDRLVVSVSVKVAHEA